VGMRNLALAISAVSALAIASIVSPIGAIASNSSRTLAVPGPNSGARSPLGHLTVGRTLIAAPRIVANGCNASFQTVMSAPSPSPNNSYLVASSALSANDIWAVGNTSVSGGYDRTLAEHWDGGSWTVVPTTNQTSFHDDLTGVVAISTNDVWVSGIYSADVNPTTTIVGYAQHWNGSSWTTYLLNPTAVSFVFGIGASSSTDVWAVGTFLSAGTYEPFVEHWNGSSWSVAPGVFNANSFDNEFFSVSALSATDVWVVGENTASSIAPSQSMAEHWNGTAWSLLTTGNSAVTENNEILWVAGLETGHAVGVGFGHFNGSQARQSQIWDLSATNPSTLNTSLGTGLGTGDNALLGVARAGAGVWAVGYSRGAPSAGRQVLAFPATWDSTGHTLTWGSAGAGDNPSAINSVFLAVTAVSPYAFWATGYENNGTNDQTLTESYCANHFNLTAPAQASTGTAFSITVTVQDGTPATVTSYRGTVQFTSSDNAAVLPANYAFTSGDNGTHVFGGVVFNTIGHDTITVADVVMPLTTPGTAILVACHGACQSPAGTNGSRGANSSPTTTAPARGVNQSGSGTSGPRVQRFGVDNSGGLVAVEALAISSAPDAVPESQPTSPVATDTINDAVQQPVHITSSLSTREQQPPPPPERSLWYALLLTPMLVCLLALTEVRRRWLKENSNGRI
jgi:hypothetical protein